MPSPPEITESGQNKWMWPFELIEQIGEGGMGVVYRARYVVNGRELALKMVPKDVTDETTLARFERELEVLKNLKHPNIVRCFGGSCANERRFYAMELVDGGTLEDKLEVRKRIPWEEVIFYGLQICAALECSHAQGVIHRDLKPSNFLLTQSGQLKLSDFGLAAVAAARKITAAGKTAGTFLYMAPEQIRGLDVSPQTDLYALGCVLFELLTGEPPFVGSTPAATLHMHCRDAPARPTEMVLDCPLEFERIILQLLEKDQENRPQSAAEVRQRLKAVKQTVKVITPEVGNRFERKRPTIVANPESGFLKADSESTKRQLQTQPTWLIVTLMFVLCVLLTGNLVGGRDHSIGEELWVQATTHENLQIRLNAIHSLGVITKETGRHLDLLKSGLTDSQKEVREASVRAIENVGGRAKSAVPALIVLMKSDPENSVRHVATRASATLEAARKPSRFPWFWIGGIITLLCVTGGAAYFLKSGQMRLNWRLFKT